MDLKASTLGGTTGAWQEHGWRHVEKTSKGMERVMRQGTMGVLNKARREDYA